MLGLVLIMTLLLCGCWDRRELNSIAIVAGTAVDTAGKLITVTYQIIVPSSVRSSEGVGSGGKSGDFVRVVYTTDKSVPEAVRDFAAKGSRKIFMAHNSVIVFGRAAARKGVYQFLDYFYRNPQVRPNTLIVVADREGGDILRCLVGLETIPALGVFHSVMYSSENSYVQAITLQDFAERMISKTTAPIAPIVYIYEENGFLMKKEKRVRIQGMAVFKRGKMVGEMDPVETEGLLWALGKVKMGAVTIPGPESLGEIGLEIKGASSQIIPVIQDGVPGVRVKMKIVANISGQQKPVNLATPEQITRLEKYLSDEVARYVSSACRKSFRLNADVFAFGEAFHRGYPGEWRKMEPRWDKLYRDLKVDISVKSQILRVGMTGKPVFPQK